MAKHFAEEAARYGNFYEESEDGNDGDVI